VASGLLFPASLAFSLDGKTLYVSNLTLFLPFAGASPAVDSAWTLRAKHYTVSQISTAIPQINPNRD
jgi:sugar lactone lactonase YvrE